MLLGYKLSLESLEEVVNHLINITHSVHVVSGNPEVLAYGLKDSSLFQEFTSNDTLIIPDGIGVCYPLRWRGYKVYKIPGIDLVTALLSRCEQEKKTIFFLGGSREVNEKLKTYIATHYPNLSVVGYCHGFYQNEKEVVEEIKRTHPHFLFVAMGAPKQESFIKTYRSEFKEGTVMMGVGGTFDVFVNKVKRAPRWMITYNLEWFYRVIKEPTRMRRFKRNIWFVNVCIVDQFKSKIKKRK